MTSVSTDRRQGVNAGAAIKVPVKVATTANITLSGAQTIDGVAVTTDDRVLVKDQTTASQNGIYVVSTGEWTRTPDFDGSYDAVQGTVVHVANGTLYQRTWFEVTTDDPFTIGTSSLTFTQAFLGDASTVSFIQSGTGAVANNVRSKLRYRVELFDFLSDAQRADVAAGTAAIDVSAAVQSAFDDGRPLYANPGRYKISSLRSIPAKLDLKGDWKFGKTGNTAFATFLIDAGVAGFQTPSTSSGFESLGISIEGVAFSGGTIQLNVRNGGVGLTLKHVQFAGPSSKCLAAAGFCQEWFFDNVEFSGGDYGFYMPNSAGSGGTPSLFDKCVMRRLYAHGQAINGIVTKPSLSNNVLWEQPTLVTITQDGWLIDGGIRDWVIANTNTESNGYLGSAPTAVTTGTITSGTANLTVGSGTGISNGDTLTVEGAGVNGADLYATVSSGGGTVNIVLGSNASTSVTGLEVSKYTYSDIKFTAAIAAPGIVTFVGGSFGITSALAGLRYAIDCNGPNGIVMINVRTTRPIYDPSRIVTLLNGSATVRSPRNFLTENFATTILGTTNYRNQIGSPNGGNLTIGMRDSAGNGSGTYGSFEVRKYDSNRTRLIYMDATTGGAMNLFGPVSPGGFGAGTGATSGISATELRIVFGNAVPTAGTWAVGEMVVNQAPSKGEPGGWQCVTAGTPGTWAPFGHSVNEGSATYDPPNLADGAGATTTVTVTGAVLGDFAEASFSLDLQGITVTAWVSAADTVSVRFQNESGGALDLASGTLRARVRKL